MHSASGGRWFDHLSVLLVDQDAQVIQLEQEFGVDVVYKQGAESIPELWRLAPSKGQAAPISGVGLKQYLALLPGILNKYPRTALADNLHQIVLLDNLSFYNTPYGGTSIANTIYLTAGEAGYEDEYVEALVHHEISSIFLRTFPFPESEWRGVNTIQFRYLSDDEAILQVIEDPSEVEGINTVYESGFLTHYGQSTFENDVNVYAEMYMMEPSKLEQLANTYPKIRKKYALIKGFYTRVFSGIKGQKISSH